MPGPDGRIEALPRAQLGEVWAIDRREVIDGLYRQHGAELHLEPAAIEVAGWPPGEAEHYGPILDDCLAHGGVAWAVRDAGRVVAAAVIEARPIGPDGDWLQLKFLHVGQAHRGRRLARALWDRAVGHARRAGARALYVSATPSRRTVQVYLRLGARPLAEPDPALFALEPEDIHLLAPLDARR